MLAGTSYENVPLESVTLGDVLANAARLAENLDSVDLGALDLSSTPLSSIPLSSIELGATPLSSIGLGGTDTGSDPPLCRLGAPNSSSLRSDPAARTSGSILRGFVSRDPVTRSPSPSPACP